MSTAPYEQAISVSRSILTEVTSEQLDNDTPCAGWKVRDLINHLVGAQRFFLSGLRGTPPVGADADVASGEFVAAYDAVASEVLAAFQEDGALAKTYQLPFGAMPGGAVLGLATTDSFVHGWDLAKATGQSTDIAPELAEGLLAQSRAMIRPEFRGGQGAPFGPEQDAPEGASAADRLAAFLGRTV